MPRRQSNVPASPSMVDERKAISKAVKRAAAKKKALTPRKRRRPTRAKAPKSLKQKMGKDFLKLSPAAQRALSRAAKVVGTPSLPDVTGKPSQKARPTSTVPNLGFRPGFVTDYKGAEMTPVVSSNVAAVGYNPEEFELYISFLNGSLYEYYGVAEEVYKRMLGAPSKGKFVWRYIRDVYDYGRVR